MEIEAVPHAISSLKGFAVLRGRSRRDRLMTLIHLGRGIHILSFRAFIVIGADVRLALQGWFATE